MISLFCVKKFASASEWRIILQWQIKLTLQKKTPGSNACEWNIFIWSNECIQKNNSIFHANEPIKTRPSTEKNYLFAHTKISFWKTKQNVWCSTLINEHQKKNIYEWKNFNTNIFDENLYFYHKIFWTKVKFFYKIFFVKKNYFFK